jgi:7-cyano-7-deazaguanine synthase
MREGPVCGLVSGGLDSAILLDHLLQQGRQALPLYVQCGFRWEAAERYWLRRFLRVIRTTQLLPLQLVELPRGSLSSAHWSVTGRGVPDAASPDTAVELPGRNLLLLSAAVVGAPRRVTTVALGTLKGNPFSDASPRFFRQMGRCLSTALGRRIRLLTPLARWTKPQLIRRAGQLPLGLTFSCLAPRGVQHCGRCNKCAERRRAFREADRCDPTRYETAVRWDRRLTELAAAG